MQATRIAAFAGTVLLLGLGNAMAANADIDGPIPPWELRGGSPTVSAGSDLQLPPARGTVNDYDGTSRVWQFRCNEAKVGAAPGNIDVAALCGTTGR
jgi:hypothetical protein